jgi:uncharacterized protein YndB with AHSA1/START domain
MPSCPGAPCIDARAGVALSSRPLHCERRTMRIALLSLVVLLAWWIPAGAAERAIDKEIVVPAPLDKVWESWTTREGIRGFFAPDAVVEPRVGGAFHIHIDPLAKPGARGADDMRFMALQPMKMLSFDWNAPPHLPEARAQRTFVVLRFEPVDDRNTRVRLHHSGWGDGGQWDQAYTYFDRAWGNVLANLKKRHESGPRDWTDWLEQLRKMHAAPAPIQ